MTIKFHHIKKIEMNLYIISNIIQIIFEMNVENKTYVEIKSAKKAEAEAAKATKKAEAEADADNDSDTDTETETTIAKQISNIMKLLPVSIQTKLKNIDKAGTEGPCTTKRVSQSSRISIPYENVKVLSVAQLATHEAGAIIRLPYDTYEEIRDKTERNELEEHLLNNIGGNGIVSCFICMTKEDGYSGSSDLRVQYKRFEEEKKLKNWTPIKRTGDGKNVNKGNDKWSGHYYYKISGGQQDSILSHPDKEDQMFTTYKGFMSTKKVINDVKACLIYSLLHCYDMCDVIPAEQLVKHKQNLEEYLKRTNYMGKSCYELTRALGTIKNGQLYSPINCERLSVKMFETEKMINISHNEAVCKNKIYFCENNQVMLSDYRPGNLFWDTHLSNMQQQDFTIEEYWIDHDKRSALRDSLRLLD